MATATATSRLKKDYQRLLKEPVPFLQAAPLPENILEWHYIIFGAPNTPYDGGVYHGKLVFPADFPFKPPSIYMITPSGRFQTNTRLCLSISDFHPDTWNPAWTVSTIITGLLSFMNDTAPTLGSITSSDSEKRLLAKRSKALNIKNRIFCELFPDVVEDIKKELSESSSEEAANQHSDKPTSSSEPTSGLSSLVSNLFVVAGVVVLALALAQLHTYLVSATAVWILCTYIISRNCSSCENEGTSAIIQPANGGSGRVAALPNTFLLVLILSSPNETERRQVIRDSWLKLSSKGPSVVIPRFPVGTKNLNAETKEKLMAEQREKSDLAFIDDLEESYENLARKTLKSIQFAHDNYKFHFLLKVDSDSFVRLGIFINALLEVQHPMLYWGFLDGRAKPIRKGKWKETDWVICDRYLPYQLGGGYVLSYQLAKFLAVNAPLFKMYKNEDVSVGAWLSGLDVKYVHDPRFDTEWISRGCHNEYLITHKKSIEDMKSLFRNLVDKKVLCEKEFRTRFSYVYDWSALPSKCCERINGSAIP